MSVNGSVPRCACSVETAPTPGPEIVVLRVSGEVDLNTQRSVEVALAGCLGPTPRYLVVDLSAVTFCSARGMSLLSDAEARATAGSARFAVCGLSLHLDRMANLLWAPGRPARYRSLAAAATAIQAEPARDEPAPRG